MLVEERIISLNTQQTRTGGNCECVANEAAGRRASCASLFWPQTVITQLPIKIYSTSPLSDPDLLKDSNDLAIRRRIALWPWPLTIWPWTFAIHWKSRDQSLYQIWSKSNNPQLRYLDESTNFAGPFFTGSQWANSSQTELYKTIPNVWRS